MGVGPSGAGAPTRGDTHRSRASHGPAKQHRDPDSHTLRKYVCRMTNCPSEGLPHRTPAPAGRRPLFLGASPQAMAAAPTAPPTSQSASPSSEPGRGQGPPTALGTAG